MLLPSFLNLFYRWPRSTLILILLLLLILASRSRNTRIWQLCQKNTWYLAQLRLFKLLYNWRQRRAQLELH
ncbi:hypothetical protein BGX38DRAFT_1164117 [Terfezia claveryi]|nr:hypothetical protein BGX38DRAFT_1164117 [Terfezia claveryi]